jgi:hypothetical protein
VGARSERALRAGTLRCTLCIRHFTSDPSGICRWCAKRGGPPPTGPRTCTANRTIVVDGVEFLVAWDGSLDGATAMGLPLAHERAPHDRNTDIWRGEWRGPGRRFDDGGF